MSCENLKSLEMDSDIDMDIDMDIVASNIDGALNCVGMEDLDGDPVGSIVSFVWGDVGLFVGSLVCGGFSVGSFDD